MSNIIEKTVGLKVAGSPRKTRKRRGMTDASESQKKKTPIWLMPLWALAWPFLFTARSLYKHFVSYIIGKVIRDNRRIYTIKFVWYGDSIYLHPMIWGSAILAALAVAGVDPNWLLLVWFATLFVCFMTIMYNFDVIRTGIMAIGLIAFFGLAYVSTVEFHMNPLAAVADHIVALKPSVTPGFYIVSVYLFTALICTEVIWAWLFHRVELDESYVYEHRFLQGTAREPIFARGLRRETKDLLELLILGAADIQHRTKNGSKRFKNVPFASLWLGTAIDSLLDYRRKSEVDLQQSRDDSDQAKHEHAFQDLDDDGGFSDDHGDDDHGDAVDDDHDGDDGIS